jgi:hypothetical protein
MNGQMIIGMTISLSIIVAAMVFPPGPWLMIFCFVAGGAAVYSVWR